MTWYYHATIDRTPSKGDTKSLQEGSAMAEMTAIQILAKYFNEGDGKRALATFQQELKALTPEEKRELALQAAPLIGATLKG